MDEIVQLFRIAILCIGLVWAVFTDVTVRKIPNYLNVFVFGAGLLLQVMAKTPQQFLWGTVAGAVVGIGGWILRVIKAGDAKLLIALGSLMGCDWLLRCCCYSLICGAVIGICILIAKRSFLVRMKHLADYFKMMLLTRHYVPYVSCTENKKEFPFAIAIALGAIATFFIEY